MHKIFLSVASMIVTHFLHKAYRKITEKPTIGKEETYRAVRDAREQWLREHQPNRPVAEVDARPMRNDQRAALSIIEQANLDLMESLER